MSTETPGTREQRGPLFRITVRRVAVALAVLAVLVCGGVFAAGWYFSNELRSDGLAVKHSDEHDYPFAVVGIDQSGADGAVMELTDEPADTGKRADLEKYAAWGVASETATGQLWEVVNSSDASVSRRLVTLSGQFAAGDRVRLYRDAVSAFHGQSTAVTERQVTVTLHGPLGDLPEWALTSPLRPLPDALTNTRWAILVHGRGASKAEPLRAWLGIEAAGYNSLDVSFRNDVDTAPDPSGYYRYGETEWEDLEPAVRYALDNGAQTIALVGYSMGGAIVMSFMESSDLASNVDALILDAPMLDFGRTVDLGAKNRSVPGIVTWTAKRLAGVRFGVHWGALNYLARIDDLSVPVLLFHGDKDPTVPVKTSREMAEKLPDLVTYEEFHGAKHVESWNVDPDRYQAAVEDFLSRF